jgi:hypothetical protein
MYQDQSPTDLQRIEGGHEGRIGAVRDGEARAIQLHLDRRSLARGAWLPRRSWLRASALILSEVAICATSASFSSRGN